MKLYIVRHAESEANTKDILAGQLDYPLSERGVADAAVLSHANIFPERPTAILCSPLVRAFQTARPTALRFSLPIRLDPRLMEQDMGEFAGKTYAQAESDPGYERDRTKRWEWSPRGGESYRMIAERVMSFFSDLETGKLGGIDRGPVLIVTHAVTMRLIRAALENTLPAYPRDIPKNGEVWTTEFQGLGRPHALRSLFVADVPAHGE